jgi:hypothetical protein
MDQTTLIDAMNSTIANLIIQNEQHQNHIEILQRAVDMVWIVTTGIGILGMQGAFAILETGKVCFMNLKIKISIKQTKKLTLTSFLYT